MIVIIYLSIGVLFYLFEMRGIMEETLEEHPSKKKTRYRLFAFFWALFTWPYYFILRIS